MGRKSSAKHQRTDSDSTRPADTPSHLSPMLIGAILVAVLGIAVLAFWRTGNTPAATGPEHANTAGEQTASAAVNSPSPEIEASTKATAAVGPHRQAQFPPIPFRGYSPPRTPEVTTAAFHFAAEHPEILSYVPCFCGCEHSGHRGNHDCFVRSRAANGDVTEWEEHGVECAVCIDVATRARQMHASGASVRDIRAAVDKEFTPKFPSTTPTPKPPAAHATH